MNRGTSSNFLKQWLRNNINNLDALSIILFFTISGFSVYLFGVILVPILISVIISLILSKIVTFLEKRCIPRIIAVLVVFLFFIIVLLFVCLWPLPIIWKDANNLLNFLSNALIRLKEIAINLQQKYPFLISKEKIYQLINVFNLQLIHFGKIVWMISIASFNSVIAIVTYISLIPILVFLFLKDQQLIKNWLSKFLPEKCHTLNVILKKFNKEILNYINGKMLEMIVMFFITLCIFYLFNLNYAILFSILMGISVIIPYIGIIFVTIPIIIVSSLNFGINTSLFWYFVIVYVLLIVFDAMILAPLLFSKKMNLHPIAIILSIFVFGYIFGFWGIFFAIPLLTLANIVITNWPTKNCNNNLNKIDSL